jgi:hypothetical protein
MVAFFCEVTETEPKKEKEMDGMLMNGKIELKGKLIHWKPPPALRQSHLTIRPMPRGIDDWAPLSGKHVRVTVELAPEPGRAARSAGRKLRNLPSTILTVIGCMLSRRPQNAFSVSLMVKGKPARPRSTP